jgi:hypothetical protein
MYNKIYDNYHIYARVQKYTWVVVVVTIYQTKS